MTIRLVEEVTRKDQATKKPVSNPYCRDYRYAACPGGAMLYTTTLCSDESWAKLTVLEGDPEVLAEALRRYADKLSPKTVTK